MSDRYQRQSFLGAGSQQTIERAKIGVVGLGGGGSHVVQQLAHIGFQDYVLYDPQKVEDTNLNRLIGARLKDIGKEKRMVARRLIKGLQPKAKVLTIADRWQNQPEPLTFCDVVFGCLDTFQERDEMEAFCRRHLIVYIDIGMDVHRAENEPPRMAGQVILSAPGAPCMKCLGFITPEALAQEAARYGAAGPRPQVVWPNGILASSAVGLAVNALTAWTNKTPASIYLSYDGNLGLVGVHPRAEYLVSTFCEHYPLGKVGIPMVQPL
jgi:molybdopterin-synthase adenylyltransferase